MIHKTPPQVTLTHHLIQITNSSRSPTTVERINEVLYLFYKKKSRQETILFEDIRQYIDFNEKISFQEK